MLSTHIRFSLERAVRATAAGRREAVYADLVASQTCVLVYSCADAGNCVSPHVATRALRRGGPRWLHCARRRHQSQRGKLCYTMERLLRDVVMRAAPVQVGCMPMLCMRYPVRQRILLIMTMVARDSCVLAGCAPRVIYVIYRLWISEMRVL